MVISERRGFVFVHNPKCAGTTVRRALMPYDTTFDLFWKFEAFNGHEVDKAHLPLFVFRSLYPAYFRLMETCLSFMFVRDPYARTVSAFNEVRRALLPKQDDPDTEESYRKSLNRFISNMTESALRREPKRYRHFVRQTDMAYIGQKRVVDLAMKVEQWPNCLAQLGVFMPDIADAIRNGEQQNVKPMARPHFSYLDDASIKRINTLYSSDFDLFDYGRL